MFGANLDYPRRVLGGLNHCAKSGNNRCSYFQNMEVSLFGANCWKTPIHAPKIVVLVAQQRQIFVVTCHSYMRTHVFYMCPHIWMTLRQKSGVAVPLNEPLDMHTCTSLQNCTIMYMNIVAVTKIGCKTKESTKETDAIWHCCNLLQN